MKLRPYLNGLSLLTAAGTLLGAAVPASAANKKPNIITIISDDFGYGDAGCYGGGEGRGMPTPGLDRIAKEGKTFYSFYAQPSCTPGRAAMLTGLRIRQRRRTKRVAGCASRAAATKNHQPCC